MLYSNTETIERYGLVRLRIEAAKAHSRYYLIFQPQTSQTQISTSAMYCSFQ
jgi:hypothetical protein